MMNKKILAVALCILLGCPCASCGSPNVSNAQDTPGQRDTQQTAAQEQVDSQETVPSSEEDKTMSDEELLAALGDNIHVVAKEDYAETVNAFLNSTDDYIGQLYQLEGAFVKEGEISYLTVNAGEDGAEIRIPLTCLTKEPEAGSGVRVTGIVNYGDVNGETAPVLDVAVIEALSE